MKVLKSASGRSTISAGPVWNSLGNRIAVIARTDAGQRTLTVVKYGADKASTDNGGVELNTALPIAGPIRSVKFISDTHIRVIGAKQQLDERLPANGRGKGDGSYKISKPLPRHVVVRKHGATNVAPVIQWVCR